MILKTAVVALMLSGCASVPEKTFYADWIAIANPQLLCAGADSCVKHAQYKGKALCTLVTADKAVSTAQMGVLINQCLN